MSNTKVDRNKDEVALLISQWATEELGFRKKTTLVTAKGEEKIQPAELEPLLHGELANILELAATHVVSSQRAHHARRRLTDYCAHLDPDSVNVPQLAQIALRNSLKQLQMKEQRLAVDVDSAHRENAKVIQTISNLESRKSATEYQIRELRLQILMKQAMVENMRRMSNRIKRLTKEMLPTSLLIRSSGVPPEITKTISSVSVTTENADCKPLDFLASLSAKVEALDLENSEGQFAFGQVSQVDHLHEQRQDAVAQISSKTGQLVSDLIQQSKSTWISSENEGNTSEIALTISRIQNHLDNIQDTLESAKETVASRVTTENKRLLKHLVYADPRDEWNSVDLWRLQQLQLSSRENGKEIRSANKLVVTSTNIGEIKRLQRLGNIVCEATGIAGQAHEVAVARVGENLVRGLHQAHVMERMRIDLAESKTRVRQLLSQESEGLETEQGMNSRNSSTLEEEVNQLCMESKEQSGRLFMDSFASWYRRDGVSYAEYLKQLKIAKAGEEQ
ncbi:hypothetical protein GGI25_003468 [Coemansia spiralis]|uniref:Uncharacterized protein n=2 Tax=Coemansia TaxID=4863 RepID=A0A9W8KWH4_9FUNG|nr:hypothetical protein EDC05_003409 [Coemansia umbellata]KAJ2621561.1 hypothetical protein GGI26_004024 [Coemansia sp. RSA 1358]KAJ2676716.1 hypothetical protein GGI25_003468 [Coemansia spiralis]